MAKKKICIIGGGISGTALGYNLSLYDDAEVTLYEKGRIGAGTTSKSAGTVCLFDAGSSKDHTTCRKIRTFYDF